MKKTVILLSIAVILICMTTCQTLMSAVEDPVVSLSSVDITGINFNGAEMLAKISIENPNAFEIPFPEIGWKLSLNSNGLIDGTIKNNNRLKAKNSTIVDVPFSFEYLEAFNAIASLFGKGSADYKVDMALKFNIPVIGEKVWNLAHEGNIPLPQVPKLSPPSLRLDKFDLSGAAIALSMNIENPNNFELPSPKIGFDFLVNNISVANTQTTTDKLKPNSTTPVTMNFSVSSADFLRAGINLVTARTISTNLNSSFDFGVPAFGGATTLNTPWNMSR